MDKIPQVSPHPILPYPPGQLPHPESVECDARVSVSVRVRVRVGVRVRVRVRVRDRVRVGVRVSVRVCVRVCVCVCVRVRVRDSSDSRVDQSQVDHISISTSSISAW